MPWLASASAQLQGKTLVEVCTVYGVSLLPLQGQEQPGDHAVHHGSEHCALTALAAVAAQEPPALAVAPVPRCERAASRVRPSPRASDACAAWVAGLAHGPPARA